MEWIFRHIVLFLLPALLVAGHPPVSEESAMKTLEERGEVYFSFRFPGTEALRELTNHISVDHILGERVYAYADQSAFMGYLSTVEEVMLHVAPGLQPSSNDISMRAVVDIHSVESWNFYPTYEAYEQMMHQFAVSFPGLIEIVALETLASGRKILFAVIGKGNSENGKGKPRFMYTSSMHGDEVVGFNLMLRLIHHLLFHYGHDDFITQLVDGLEIWICPNENPDGTYTNDNATILGATRFNGNAIDLNRNYPCVRPQNCPAADVQPETRAMMQLTDSLHFVISANIHGGTECVNFPWDYWRSSIRKHADHDWWYFVSREYADTARYNSHANYMNPWGISFFDGVTHGGDWYTVSGSRQDYMNYYANQRELTLELSNQKMLASDSLENHWQYNYRSLLNYMHQGMFGIHGVVADRAASVPLEASVLIPGHDFDNSEVYSSLPFGIFHRPLLEGTYDLLFNTAGYPDLLYEQLEIRNYETFMLDADPGRIEVEPFPVIFPTAVAMGESQIGLWLHNPSQEAVSLYLDGFSGDPFFDLAYPLKRQILIPAGEADVIWLAFRPEQAGGFSADLRLAIEMPYQPVMLIPLSGHAPEEAALLQVPAQELNFGYIAVGKVHTMMLSLHNPGNQVLTIQEAGVTDPAFTLDASFPLHIGAGEWADIPITFTPLLAKSYLSLLTFESNAYSNSPSVELKGEGTDPTSVVSNGQEGPSAAIFPNPLVLHSVLELKNLDSGPVHVRVVNAFGREMAAWNSTWQGDFVFRILLGEKLSHLPAGLYYCQVMTGKSFFILKFIVTGD